MDLKGIIITGTSAAGKTSIQRILCNRYSKYSKVKAVTTRKQRADDRLEDYSFITNEKFIQLQYDGNLLVEAEYRGERYGITYDDIKVVLDNEKIPILLITSKSIEQIAQGSNNTNKGLISFFIDASDETLDERLSNRDGLYVNENLHIEKQRIEDREYIKSCLHYLVNYSSEKSAQIIHDLWQKQCDKID
jgi:guanylate kinase